MSQSLKTNTVEDVSLPDPQWFALMVKPRHEKAVDAALRSKGIESLLPLYSERRQWADRKTTVSLPLFPGYVFSRFATGCRSRVLSTPGLFDVVRCGRDPAPIPNGEIAALELAIRSGRSLEPWPHLAIGEMVEMDAGPLLGLTGKVLEIKNSARLVLSVNLLNRSILVEIEREWIRPLPSRAASPVACPSGVVALRHSA